MDVLWGFVFSPWGVAGVTTALSALAGWVHRRAGGDWSSVILIVLGVAVFTTYLYDYYVVANPPQVLRVARIENRLDEWLNAIGTEPKQRKTLNENELLRYEYTFRGDKQGIVLLEGGSVVVSGEGKFPDYVNWRQSIDQKTRMTCEAELLKILFQQDLQMTLFLNGSFPVQLIVHKTLADSDRLTEQYVNDSVLEIQKVLMLTKLVTKDQELYGHVNGCR